jgi:hypothetical protein
VIPDVDIWRAALLMVKRYGDDAMYPTVDLKERLLTLYTWR